MTIAAKFATTAKEAVVGVALIGVAFLLTNVLAVEVFNITGISLVVVNLIPTFLAVGLLLKALDIL